MSINKYKEKSKRFFNKSYNTKYGNSKTADKFVLEFLLRDNPQNILDLSCGDGRTAEQVSRLLPQSKITGIDISDKSIAHAKSRDVKSANFVVGEVDDLPFEDDSFDCIYSINSFHHYPEPEKSFAEMVRVLKTGGKLYLADIYLWSVVRQIINAFLPYGNKGDYKIHSKQEFLKMAHDAGLENIEYKSINYCIFKAVYIKK